jgi:hypothetical protein
MTETDFSIETLIVEEPQRAKALAAISKRAQGLLGQQQELLRAQSEVAQQLTEVNDFLAISDAVTDALDKLSHDVFQRQLSDIEKTITKALQDVLDQPIEFEAVASFKNNGGFLYPARRQSGRYHARAGWIGGERCFGWLASVCHRNA